MKQKGVSLIEVMVAVFILGAGLLGLGGLQARAVMMNQSAFYRSIAADIAADLADRIRANRSPYLAVTGAVGAQAIEANLPLPPDFSTCTGVGAAFACPQRGGRNSYQVVTDMQEWTAQVGALLPNGNARLAAAGCATPPANIGQVSCRYTLTLTWRDDRSTNTDGSYVTVIE